MVSYNFKSITVVPNANDFVDIVLTRTQRKTPTVVHKGYKISILRKFYMRKVKFTQQTITDKFQLFLTEFPVLDEIHPFYADLMNVLYDKDHYKLALGQINAARRLVDNIASDYIRLLKYGDSLYRCKQLKRAALGRMVKVIRRLGPSLSYLEQVRQHLARLPQIDPTTRTLLVCGYPNVGKSSFMNKVTRANVDVQPYAFTTKSLFVGHMDYKFLRWQVIDTPGILDHPVEDRNVIEMQSITALAHLMCSVLFFIDISETCGYSIEQQIKLFDSISPLFENKPLVFVLNKIDIRRVEELKPEETSMIENLKNRFSQCQVLPMSSVSEEGVSTVKKIACDMILDVRVNMKLRGVKRDELLNRMHVSIPVPRDDISRLPYVPESVKEAAESQEKEEYKKVSRKKLAEYEEQQKLYHNMDPDYRGVDWKQEYTLEDNEWRYDKIPEIMDGENISDWVDADLESKWGRLEQEEAELLQQIAITPKPTLKDPLTNEELFKLAIIRNRKAKLIRDGRMKKLRNHRLMPLQHRVGTVSNFEEHLKDIGVDAHKAVEYVRGHLRPRSKYRSSKRALSEGTASIDPEKKTSAVSRRALRQSLSRLPKPGVSSTSFGSIQKYNLAKKLEKRAMAVLSRRGGSGPGDRSIPQLKPKHLFSGKRTVGSTDRR
ncbi:GTP-binding protein 4-like [Schistocerca gregaria]|uniref:GTP-binding protein 4-like n=1 Tax=Schistocerca gregaria TaxID=7010 RepID=UPI00211E8526|nr:GTP-binding protein 4-like [Schistocerca gregaria]